MNLNQLEAFVKIANNNSFSQTAKELYLTQPTVSAYISNLEKELGVKLFSRSTKEVVLTEAGQKIYIYARGMLELADKIQNTTAPAERDGGQLIISASSIPGRYLLPDILAHFCRRYPNAEFRVHETDSIGVVEDIREGRSDIGFAGTAVRGKNVSFFPFYEDELVVAVPNTEKYRELSNKTDDMSWLRDENWIMREKGSGTLKETLKLLKKIGISHDHLHVVASFSNTGAILMSVRNRTGIAVVSRLAAETYIENKELLAIPLHAEGAYRKINIVYSTDYLQSSLCKKMIQLVKELYRR